MAVRVVAARRSVARTEREHGEGRVPADGPAAEAAEEIGPLLDPEDPSWVDARPFRAHLQHLMGVGSLDVPEVAAVLGLSTRSVAVLLHGRSGRPTRRISTHTARRLLRVSAAEVRELRWCVTPAEPARSALGLLRTGGWSDADVAGAVGFGVADLEALAGASRCNRLLAVRLVGLARSLPTTIDDQDLTPLVPAA